MTDPGLVLELTTPRLRLLALTGWHLSLLLDEPEELERLLGLVEGHARLPAELRQPVQEMLNRTLADPANTVWTTNWQIVAGSPPRIVGGFCFKGAPDNGGEVEIGYGLNPGSQGQGFMTEALSVAVPWALEQPGVQAVIAETERDNLPSQAVLRRTGFVRYRETATALWWRRQRRADTP